MRPLTQVDSLEVAAVGAARTQTRGRQQPRLSQPFARTLRFQDVPDARIPCSQPSSAASQAIPSTSIISGPASLSDYAQQDGKLRADIFENGRRHAAIQRGYWPRHRIDAADMPGQNFPADGQT